MRLVSRTLFRSLSGSALSILCLSLALPAQAATPLATAFAAAWERQPAAAAFTERERAAAAGVTAANALIAAPPSLELASRTDRYNRRQGAQENELGLVLPLWLPGERSGSQALAAAEAEGVSARRLALQLRLAQVLRDTWWSWQSARNDTALAADRLTAARQLRDDVAHRHDAGDLSRADLHQAEGALALAEAQQAEAEAQLAGASYRLASLTGQLPQGGEAPAEASPDPTTATSDLTAHPLLAELANRAAIAERSAELARRQMQSNPELAISTRVDRAATGLPNDQTWMLALRVPLGGGAKQDARIANARADAIEAGIELSRERERLEREAGTLRLQVQAARQQLDAAERRARLARETRGFYDKSFRLGQTDLPQRLRIEQEAFEAERALIRARLTLAQGISNWRQALGLLPD